MLQIKGAELHVKGKDHLTENGWDCNSRNLPLVPDQPEPCVSSGKPTKLVPLLHGCGMPVAPLLKHFHPKHLGSVTANIKGEPIQVRSN